MTTTKEITVYEQHEKTYCEDCKPQGGKRSTLVVSSYDRFCQGCGQDFLEMAEDDELSPEDITAIEEAIAQPTLGPFTFEELCQSLEGERQLQHAWEQLQAMPAYTERCQRYHAGLSAFFQVVALLASQEVDPLSLNWEEANLWRELQDAWEEVSYAASC